MLRAAASAGTAIFEHSQVKRIERVGDRVRLVTRGGALTASRVVIATGYATKEFQPLVGRFRMKYSYVLATEPIGWNQRSDLGLGDVMLWDSERPYHYARWTPDRRLLLGGADIAVRSGRHRAERSAAAAVSCAPISNDSCRRSRRCVSTTRGKGCSR